MAVVIVGRVAPTSRARRSWLSGTARRTPSGTTDDHQHAQCHSDRSTRTSIADDLAIARAYAALAPTRPARPTSAHRTSGQGAMRAQKASSSDAMWVEVSATNETVAG